MHSRRLIISKLQTIESAHKLVDEIAPKLSARNSGHLRVSRTTFRRGDNVELAKVSFVDDLATVVNTVKTVPKVKEEAAKPKTARRSLNRSRLVQELRNDENIFRQTDRSRTQMVSG